MGSFGPVAGCMSDEAPADQNIKSKSTTTIHAVPPAPPTTAFIFDDPFFALLRQEVIGYPEGYQSQGPSMSRPSTSHQPSPYTNGVKRSQLPYEEKYEDPRYVNCH